MAENFWFNRMVEHWSIPERLDLVEHVRRAKLQIVQVGTFGPMFYSLADDPGVNRHWVGMPLVGIEENLACAAELIPQLQKAGARVVGQMSMAWNYGNHEEGKGLFDAWDKIWTKELLGTAPCASAEDTQQRLPDGSLRRWDIEGRPYLTYSGCMCNPHWLATLKPMVKKAIELGIDGFNVHHNFENFCRCSYCQNYVLEKLRDTFDTGDLQLIFGRRDLAEVADLLTFSQACPEHLRKQFQLTVNRATHLRRKEALDEIYIAHGRSLKPDLLLAQWYHKYDFMPHDERSLLPSTLWATDESYIWYSQGGYKGMSFIKQGYLADMGLPARFIYAAGGGKPFVINKYDFRRLRLSIAEAAANHGAALAYHWGYDENPEFAVEDYYAPVIRYQRFLADHEPLLHPARPWAQIALVYPRRAELEDETDCLEPLKRIGRLLEDRHLLFDIILDEQLLDYGANYHALILPDVKRLSPEEGTHLKQFVEKGGKLVFTGDTGKYQLDGQPHPEGLLAEWELAAANRKGTEPAGVCYVAEGHWEPDSVEVRTGVHLQVYPSLEDDSFGQNLLRTLEDLLGEVYLETDAPWFVRVRAWRPEAHEALVLHWVNYQQDEEADIEIPQPIGPVQVECIVPEGYVVQKVEWLYPEKGESVTLHYETAKQRIRFTIPSVIVYGLSVLHLRKV